MSSRKFNEYKGLDLPQLGREVLEVWDRENTFGRSITEREGAPAFIFYEGPPSANGLPGIHHVLSRTIKDTICRYKTQQGYLVRRKAGWDTHGLPVELGVEKKLGITKEDIGHKISIEEYNRTCREAVMEFTGVWEELTRKMGYWVDMKHPYITYENKYIETLWWMLKQLFDKGLLYKGYTIQPYSPAAGTGLSNHELNQPGCYRDVKDTTCTAQFEIIRDERSEFLFDDAQGTLYFLAWTTTPWTLPSNTALAVGDNIEYVRVKCLNPYTQQPQTVILAKELLPAYFTPKMEGTYSIGERIYKGSELVGIRYRQLIDWVKPMGDAFRVISGDYVTTVDGTGIVHIAPTFGADDDRVGKQAGIVPMYVVDRAGKNQPMVDRRGRLFRIEDMDPDFVAKYVDAERYREWAGRFVKNAYDPSLGPDDPTLDIDIAVMLKGEGKAFKIEKHTHSYPHCWRTDKPVLYYPLDSWFIRTTALRETRLDRDGPFREVARRARGLEPLPFPLLGHAAADMGDGRPLRTQVHRFGGGAARGSGESRSRGSHEKQPAGGVPRRRLLGGELQHLRPAPPLCGRHRPCIGQGRTHAARKRPHRRLVRQRRHALCPGALSV